MKSLRPGNISIFFTLLLSCIITGIFYIVQKWGPETNLKYIFFFILVALFIFFITSLLLGIYIEKRLKPIFKIIREVPVEQVKKSKQGVKANAFNLDVNMEVSKWATHKQEEIRKLKELERYRKEFVGNVSHELKTPIFNIQGYILTLTEGGIDDPRINKLYLQRTVKSIDRMISIVEDLESINKLESGVLKLNKESFNIVKLVEDVFEIEHMIAKERKISLDFSTRTDKPVYVFADKKRITEILNNLVVNAIKYGKKGGEVKVGFFDIDDHIIVEVRDNGIGIEKEQLPRIFERFYRIDKHRSREQGGTGLGLSIVKHIIEAHEQTINVKSQPDIGSTFTFTLEKGKN
ncbi:MAG: sensor histidine kinase [Prolixibacteraceae bacterium]|nr:sensor histidine kinase [Prolixibacteraceae bacterium]